VARIKLRLGTPQTGSIRLDDDPSVREVADQLPDVEIVARSAVGRDADGSRMWGWSTVQKVPSVSYEERRHVSDDLVVLQVRVVVLFGGDLPDPADLGFKVESVAGSEAVFRVTGHEWNGFRLQLEGELVV